MKNPQPAKSRSRSTGAKANRTVIIVALIGAIATIIAALVGAPFVERLVTGGAAKTGGMTVRVANEQGQSLVGAKTLLFFQGGPLSTYTDTNGSANFAISDPNNSEYRLVIEKDGYEPYETTVDPTRDNNVSVRLKNLSGEKGTIFVRAVDDKTSQPLQGTPIQLFVGNENYVQSTDSNGISKFTLNFPAKGSVDAEISVTTKDYQVNNQQLTLQPSKIQDVRLNAAAGTAQVAPIQVATLENASTTQKVGSAETQNVQTRPRRTSCAEKLTFGQTVECTISTGSETATHTFSVASNDVIVITMVRIADLLEPSFAVYNAQGNAIAYCGAAENLVAEVECRLDEAGVYNIRVQDRQQTHPGKYLLTVQRRNNPGNAVPLKFGEAIIDSVQDIAQRNTYTFSVGVNDIVLITATKTADDFQPSFGVYNPDGNGVAYCGGDDSLFVETTCTFNNAGTYNIQIVDRGRINAGQYMIYAQRLNRPGNTQVLEYGVTTRSSIRNTAELGTFVFESAGSQKIKVTATQKDGQVEPSFQVYNPDGQAVSYCGTSGAQVAEATCNIDKQGKYMVLFTDRSRVNTGDYEIAVEKVP